MINLRQLSNEGQALTIQVSGYCGFSSFDGKNFDGQLGRTKLSKTLLPITFKNSVLGQAVNNQNSAQRAENIASGKNDQPPSYEESFTHRPPLAGGNISQ